MGRFQFLNCFGFLRTPTKKWSLKAQLFSSFGLAAFLSLFLVVISSCFIVSNSGQQLIDRSQDLMVDQVENRLLSSSELYAFAGRASFVEESVEILVQSVQDRIAGYPTIEGWESGKHVPFEAGLEGTNGNQTTKRVYPLNQPPVPLDWQIFRDIDVDGIDYPFLDPNLIKYPEAISSTKTAHYRIPGSFYTVASAPPMNETMELLKDDGLYQSTGDLSVILKTMYEAIPEALTVEINFFNGGKGSTLQYPATATDDETFIDSYVTEGCEWMTEMKNPFTGRPYASKSMCQSPGTSVPSRLRNPMESESVKRAMQYTSQQFEKYANNTMDDNVDTFTAVPPTTLQRSKIAKVLNDLVSWCGPLISTKDNKSVVLTLSKAIFDRITSELIGVVTIEVLEQGLSDDLQRRSIDDDSDVYVVSNLEASAGIIVGTTPDAKHEVFEKLPEYDIIAAEIQKAYFDRIPEFEQWKNAPEGKIPEPEPFSKTFFTKTNDDGFLVAVPAPPIPDYPWDNPGYTIIALNVQKIPPIFGEFDEFADHVRNDVKRSMIICMSLGFFGLVLIVLVLAVMSDVLAQPLTWINIVARQIISNDNQIESRRSIHSEFSYSDAIERLRKSKKWKKNTRNMRKKNSSSSIKFLSQGSNGSATIENQDIEAPASEDGNDSQVVFVNFDYHPEATASVWCVLRTELQQLLEAFQSMIHGFSGDSVSEVAEPGLHEIKNSLTWHSNFSRLYEGHSEANVEAKDLFKKHLSMRQLSASTRATTNTTIESIEGENSIKNLGPLRHFSDSTHESDFNRSLVLIDALHHDRLSSEIGQENPMFRSSVCKEQDSSNEDFCNEQDSSNEDLGMQQDTLRSALDPECGQALPGPLHETSQVTVPAPMKVNLESNLGAPKGAHKPIQSTERPSQKIEIACRSRLFWWILILMALPVFVTNSIIGAIVSISILVTLPTTWMDSAKQASNNIEMDAMQLTADRKAAIIANLMRGPARDLYMMTRITNWIVFAGIRRSDSLISLESSSESCKGSRTGECQLSSSCSCDWEYGWNVTGGYCDIGGSTIDSRYLQQQWFEVQKTDSDPVTGSRRSSPSFPSSLNSPESTEWWENVSSLPGSEVGSANVYGYETLFDRVVMASASSVINFPIYNYPSGVRKRRMSFGGYLAFADDGLLLGWSGCDDWHSSVSNFVSTNENGASLIDDDLCANGKYGYDPRCRSWYVQGRKTYLENDVPAHITPPYRDGLSDQIWQTITSPIANPKTGEYVGQVALDFKLDFEYIVKMLDEESSLTFMITPHEDILGGDTVVSPGSEKGWASAKIEELIFVNEPDDVNCDYFKQEVLPLMKAGKRGNTSFPITNKDGMGEEICLYYTPVMMPISVGLRPDDFTVGINTTEYMIYSLGVGKPCDEIKRPYDGVEDAVNHDMHSQEETFIAIIVSSTVFFIVFSAVTAMYIAFPMIKVSNIVKSTKKGEYDDIPPLEGGCKEVQDVYNTFAKLNKIVKISNTSFFSGKLDLAHHFMSDALVLYRKINDRKAIGVTCNNLANTLFAIQYERFGNLNCCDTPMTCYVAQALALYDEALNYSQRDFEGAEGDLKVDYAMQLSDRLFNRGLYYLFIDGFSCAPDDSRERGYNDINFSRNLHDDIRDYLLENKQLFAKASPYFSRLLRRINCLAAFYDDVGLRDIWDASTLLEEANQLVAAAVEASSNGNFCPLFQEINRSGRQQQLENLEILLALKSGDDYKAARTGMRMLVEDVYLIESAFTRAAEAVLRYMKECPADESFSKRSIECARSDFRAMVKSCKKGSLEIGKNAVFVFEINPSQWKTIDNTISTDGGELLVELNKQCLGLYDNFFQEDDEIGIVANTVSDAHSVEIGRRDCNEGRQRMFMNLATSSSSSIDEERPSSFPRVDDCFPIALQMLIDSSVSLQSDSYLVWVTDGCVRREEPAMISLRDQIEQLNQERSYQVHVLVICLNRFRDSIDCESDNEDNGEDLLQELGSVTKKSAYLSPDSNDELVSAFQWVSCILSENRTTSEFISFLTMEKF